ncbi:unnamed protein product [Ectocarpus sp. CCAP 1310/34]|nr:unnamed protein product [Ectocarpus sp. CCAP 1310/34]
MSGFGTVMFSNVLGPAKHGISRVGGRDHAEREFRPGRLTQAHRHIVQILEQCVLADVIKTRMCTPGHTSPTSVTPTTTVYRTFPVCHAFFEKALLGSMAAATKRWTSSATCCRRASCRSA